MMGRMWWTLAALVGVGIGQPAPVAGQVGPTFYPDRKLVEQGFAETAEKVDITAFGSLAQAFVVFQPAVAGRPVRRRGLDCLQLTRVDGRWWIISVITDWEGPNQPIPERISGGSLVGRPGEA